RRVGPLLKLLGENAAQRIGHAARLRRHDDADRLGRKLLGESDGGSAEKRQSRGGADADACPYGHVAPGLERTPEYCPNTGKMSSALAARTCQTSTKRA